MDFLPRGPEKDLVPRPHFRVIRHDDDTPEPGVASEGEDCSPGKVSENMRLPQFYHRWFVPIVVEGQGRAVGTDLGYRSLLHWWKALTTDPPLRLIDPFVIATFSAKLRKATYRRGKLGIERPLSPNRVSILLRNLRAILNRVGEQRDPSKETAGLKVKVPVVPVETVEAEPKPHFSLDEAKRIIAAAYKIDRPRLEGIEPWQFWRGLLSWYYVTGLRRGTLLNAEWHMTRCESSQWFLNVPGRLVEKTGKPKKVAIPGWAWDAVECWPRRGAFIFTWPHDVDHLNDVHYELQRLANIPDEQQLSIQGWRRTHSNAMGELGFDIAKKLAQLSMCHGDEATTQRHYADFENRARLRLPPLWDEPIDDSQKRLFD